MATYNRTADLEVEAHPLGASSPPTWYTTLIADGTIDEITTGQTYKVGTLTGWKDAVVGDYVVFVAQVDGPPVIPKHADVIPKDEFEATYELDEA